MTTEEVQDAARRVAEALTGTCMDTVEQHLEALGLPEELKDEPAFEKALDSHVFSCDGCGWWCGADELNNDGEDGDQLCDQCDEERGSGDDD